MNNAIIYIHGKGGNAYEADRYKPLFKNYDIIGLDYKSETPWDAKNEFGNYFNFLAEKYQNIFIIANSIGAYFTMSATINEKIKKAFFISPVVDMENLILNMMTAENISEEMLESEKEIQTQFGETLSWKYLEYVRDNPTKWNVKTHILYGENDYLTKLDTMKDFCKKFNFTLDIMPHGEHWFHTQEQLNYVDEWLKKYL